MVERIGRGGMASVFRAHDPELNRFVAVKVLPSFRSDDPTFVERFRQEAQAVASLNHPNIVQVYDFGEDKGFLYIVMELVTGGTLHDRMGRRLPLDEALGLIAPLAEALEFAHDNGVVHRDVKPTNVLMDSDGNPKLSDFGLARMLEGGGGLTGSQSVLGTPDYISPEQAMGRPVDSRTDLYSLAIIIYQMLLGRTPFGGDTPSTTLLAHIHQPVPAPREVDPDIDPLTEVVLIKALAKSPDDRYKTPTELVRALAPVPGSGQAIGVAAGEATIETPAARAPLKEVLVETTSKSGRQRPIVLAIAGAVIAVVAVGVWAGVTFTGSDGEGAGPPVGDAGPPAPSAQQAGQTTVAPRGPTGAAAVGASTTATATVEAQNEDARPRQTATSLTASTAQGDQLAIADSLAGIFKVVSEVRGLEPLEDVTLTAVTANGLREFVLNREVYSKRDDIEAHEALLKILELVPADLDLFTLLEEIESEALDVHGLPVALYDRKSGEIYVNEEVTQVGPSEEFVIAAEYTLALVYQHFGVRDVAGRLRDDRQAALALELLVVGDAASTAQDYMSASLSPEQVLDNVAMVDTPIFDGAPEAVRRSYSLGQAGVAFVAAMAQSGQQAALRLVYSNPPVSTEQIYHPERYLEGDDPIDVALPDLAGPLGPGWTELHHGVMGEAVLRSYLAEISETEYQDAAFGWGGDRFSLLEGPQGQRVLVALSVWDTPDDAAEFVSLVRSRVDAAAAGFVGASEDRVLLAIGVSSPEFAVVKDQFPQFGDGPQ